MNPTKTSIWNDYHFQCDTKKCSEQKGILSNIRYARCAWSMSYMIKYDDQW